MALKHYNPTSPGRRQLVLVDRSELYKGRPEKSLVEGLTKTGGRGGGGRIAVHEILVNTAAVASMIRENNIAQIRSAIQTGGKEGMVTMENSIKAALAANLIERDVAERRIQRQRKV